MLELIPQCCGNCKNWRQVQPIENGFQQFGVCMLTAFSHDRNPVSTLDLAVCTLWESKPAPLQEAQGSHASPDA